MDDGEQVWSPYPGFEACNYDPYAVLNIIENCFYVQEDCEVEYPEYYDCECKCINDYDGDEVCDELDNCPDIYNPNQEDFNDNGIGDACEIGLDETIIQHNLITTTDVLGRNIHPNIENVLIFERYDDGTVEKRIQLRF